MRAQTRRTLENVRAVLEAGGASVEGVIMFRVYLTAREHFPAQLPHEAMLVEIDALAVTGS